MLNIVITVDLGDEGTQIIKHVDRSYSNVII